MAEGHHHLVFQSFGIAPEYNHIAGAALVAVGLTAVGLVVRAKLRNIDEHILPAPKTTLVNLSASLVSGFKGLLDSMIGHGAEKYVAFVGTYFLFILFMNLTGLIPGLGSPTDNLNTNLGMGAIAFVAYQFLGFKEHGLHYFQQFTGGLPPKGYGFIMTLFLSFVAAAIVLIELIGHTIRPVSLSLRLWGNINGDHKLVEAVSGMVPLVVPMLAMGLGVFVCLVQAFVFSLLSAVYIKLAVSHDH